MTEARNSLSQNGPRPAFSGLTRLYFLPMAAGGFAAILGLLVLVAWYAHWTAVLEVFPNLPPMKFNTALAFILCGSGLVLLKRRPLLSRWLGVGSILIGCMTLSEYVTGGDFGIDQLFIRDPIETATSFPGRMSPLAASCFTFSGIALVIASMVRKSKASLTAVGLLGCVVAMIAFVSLFGYIFGIDVATGWGHYTRLALHTSVTFVLLGLGLLVGSWEAADRIQFNFLRWVPVTASLTLIVMTAVVSSVSFAHFGRANYWQKHSSTVIDVAQGILGDLTDTQRGMRGYILSGQPEALKVYQHAVDDLPTQLTSLQTLTSENSDQQSRLKSLESSVGSVIAYSHRLLSARESQGVQGTVAIEEKGGGLAVMNQARADLQAFTDEEHRLLDERRKEADSDFENTKRLVILSTVLAAAMLLVANLMATREVNFRRQAEADLFKVAATQQAILNSANHAIISVDTLGTILTFNETAEHWFGYSAAELVGKANPSIFHVPEEVVARAKVLTRELGREIKPGFETFVAKVGPGKPAENEWTFIRKDGSRFPVWLSISWMTDITGKLVGYLGVVADLTIRREMETALEKKSLLLDGILTNSLDGVIAYETVRDGDSNIKDFRFTLVNPSAEKLSKAPAAQLIGRSLLETFPDVAPDGLFDKFVQIADTGRTQDFEYCSSRTNPPRWYRVTGSKLGDGISISYMEITERRKAEETLRHSEERFRLIVDGVKDYALFMLSPDGLIASWNEGAERLKGYKAAEIIGKHFSCFYPAEEVERGHPEEELKLAAKVGRYEEEGWRIRKDGSRFLANVVITALYTESRVLQGFAKITRDVTEQNRFQSEILQLNNELEQRVAVRTQELSVSEKRFRFLAETMPQIIWTTKPDGAVDYFNQRWFDYTGFTMAQTRDWGWTPVLHPDDLDKCIELWTRALKTGGTYEVEYRFKRGSDGAYRWHLGRAFPYRDEKGTIIQWVGTCTDIDDLKLAEERVRKTNEELEGRVAERTAQLRDKNLELENAARTKNSFVANMSHELRTPLNGIIGFSELLVDGLPGEVNPEQREYLGDILNSGRHLLQLINDVLDLAKVEAGKMELHPESFLLSEAIEQALFLANALAQKKRIEIISHLPEGLDQVTLDKQKFKQVLYNLLSNAVKFTPEKGKIEIKIIPQGEDHFSLAVTDTGIGIKSENIGRLFKEFEQLDEGATRHYQGTGLGLALTRKIVEMQGGTIKVESDFGHGSTFTVVLPVTVEAESI